MKNKFLFRIAGVFILSIFINIVAFSQTQLTNINPSGSSNPDHFVDLNGTLFFNAITYANSGDTASALFKLVGTNPVLVQEGVNWVSVGNLTVMGDYVYFSVIQEVGADSLHQLWRSNGTGGDLIKVINPTPEKSSNAIFHEVENSTEINNLLVFNNHLYFSADNGIDGDELWISDGAPGGAGTYMLKDINQSHPGVGSTINFMTADADKFYFVANDSIHGIELWVSNGTQAGTNMVKDMDPIDGTQLDPLDPLDVEFIIEELIILNGYLYFAGFDGNGVELWRTDGTEASTIQITDIDGTVENSRVTRLVVIDGWIYMGATDRGTSIGITGRRLWKHSGVVGDPAIYIVDNLVDPKRDYDPKRLLKAGETIYYSASDGIHGREMWVTDGVTAHILKDIFPAGSYPGIDDPSPRDGIDINGKLIFTADDFTYGQELWRSEGTEETTVRVTNINPSGGIEFTEDLWLVIDNVYYFAATSGSDNKELWAINILHFTEQPVPSTDGSQGETGVSLTVAAIGEGVLTYQWQKDGIDIEGATSSTLEFLALTLEDSGTYNCIVSDGFYGDLTSNDGVLTVQESINITEQPAALTTACLGDANITLSVVATGTENLTYQWKFDGTEIVGATSASIVIQTVEENSGTYICVLTDGSEEVTTEDAVVTILAITEITTQPVASTTACINDTEITLSVVATGTGTLTYQWKLNDTDIVDATSASIVIQTVEANSGTYTCVVTGECGEVISDNAVVTINASTEITTQPAALTTSCLGDADITLSVVASGTGTLTYQWKIDDVEIVDAISSSIIILSDPANNGTYTCVVSGDCGVVTSEDAVVTVYTATEITTQPDASTTVCEDDTEITLSVVAAGSGTIIYQWKLDDVEITDAISSSLVIVKNPTNSGTYVCVVTSDCGEITSNDAVVIINAATEITTQPVDLTTVCAGDTDITLSVVASGTGTLTYQWKIGESEIIGATSSSFVIATNTSNSGTYTCVISSDCGEVTSANAVVNIYATSIVTQPDALTTACEGDADITLTVVAGETGPLTYQWKKDDVDIPSATSSSLLIPADLLNSGTYVCVLTGDCGEVISNNAVVVINAATVITTQPTVLTTVCAGDTDITLSIVATGTGTLTYQWKLGGSLISGAISSSIVIVTSPSNSGTYTCVVSSDCEAVTSTNAVVNINTTVITRQPAALKTACEGDANISLSIAATGMGTLTYQWKKGAYDISGATSSSLVIASDLSNNGTYSCVVTSDCGTVTSTNTVVIIDAATEIISQPTASTTAYEGDSDITLSVVASGAGTLTYQWKLDNIAIGGATSASLGIGTDPSNSGTYTCVVSGDCGELVSNDAVVTILAATTITSQPESLTTVCVGDTDITLFVVASGAGTLEYQWKLDNIVIGGATSASIVISTDPSSSGTYTCVVTGGYGEETSTNAVVIINAVTEITTQPESLIAVCEGDMDITLSVVASGAGTLTYQWKLDNIAVGGATSASLVIGPDPSNSGTYSCVVTGDCNVVTSANADVTINAATAIATQPLSNEDVEEGASVTFSIVAEGEDLTYQWRKDEQDLTDDVDISGVLTALLSIVNVSVDDEGDYDCVVTGYCGTINSEKALLTIKNTTSLDELAKEGITVFPNPSLGKFAIKFNEVSKEVVINIYDLTGKAVYTNAAKADYFDIDISEKPNGIYILRIEFADRIINSKIIIE